VAVPAPLGGRALEQEQRQERSSGRGGLSSGGSMIEFWEKKERECYG
jgi:hypothetical protein